MPSTGSSTLSFSPEFSQSLSTLNVAGLSALLKGTSALKSRESVSGYFPLQLLLGICVACEWTMKHQSNRIEVVFTVQLMFRLGSRFFFLFLFGGGGASQQRLRCTTFDEHERSLRETFEFQTNLNANTGGSLRRAEVELNGLKTCSGVAARLRCSEFMHAE